MTAFTNDARSVSICTGLLCTLAVGLLIGSLQKATAQDTSVVANAISQSDRTAFERGVRAAQNERYREAQAHLAPLARRQPIPRHPTYGSPITWFGRVLQQRGNAGQAQQVWLQGVRDAETAGQTAVGAADALLQSMDADAIRSNAESAIHVFEHIIRALGSPVSAAERDVLQRHAAQLAIIAPDSIAQALSTLAKDHGSSPNAAVGSLLMRWLHTQDPVLATTQNERVLEHLIRVRTAEEQYAWSERPSGLDDRGETYVRFGPPDRKDAITYKQAPETWLGTGSNRVTIPSLRDALFSEHLSPDSFPVDNEIWIYPELPSSTHFIFVKRPGDEDPYLQGTPRDLLPIELRYSHDPSLEQYAVYLALYAELAFADSRYASRYSQLRGYNPMYNPLSPTEFLGMMISEYQHDDRLVQKQREENAPKQKTQMFVSHPPMPVAIRTARFLEEDGSTRTEIYWSAEAEALSLSTEWMENVMKLGHYPSGNYVVHTSGALRTPDLRAEDVRSRTDTVSIQEMAHQKRLSTRSLILNGQADRYQVDLEWIQRTIGTEGESGLVAHVTKQQRKEQALSADPSRLEMSDVRLLSVPEGSSPLPNSDAEARRRVVPFEEIHADRPIALGFEIYHLAFGEDDRTRYTIEYGITSEEKRGGLAGLLGRTRIDRTATQSTYSGTSRQATEYILLELNNTLDLSKSATVNVAVHVTDEVTGQTVNRSITFTLLPPDGSS